MKIGKATLQDMERLIQLRISYLMEEGKIQTRQEKECLRQQLN